MNIYHKLKSRETKFSNLPDGNCQVNGKLYQDTQQTRLTCTDINRFSAGCKVVSYIASGAKKGDASHTGNGNFQTIALAQ